MAGSLVSCNRENVVWQSADGTWSRGFFEFWAVNQDDEDWDFEWDVEYGSDFHWVSTGHATMDDAYRSWTGANPGGCWDLSYRPETADECARYDAKAAACKAKAA